MFCVYNCRILQTNEDIYRLVHIDAETQFTTYKILNLLGQVIAQGKIENKTVLVSNLASGTYLLEVSDNETSAVKRFIKQ